MSAACATELRSLADLVEEAAARLTSEQLYAVAGRVAADEWRDPEPELPQPNLAAACAFDLDGTVRRLVAMWGPRGVGVDLDIVSGWLHPQLLRARVSEPSALAALHRCTGWRLLSDEDRATVVTRAMLADWFPPAVVRRAIAEAFNVDALAVKRVDDSA